MQTLAIPGFYMWSRWQPDRRMFFSSYLRVHEGGNLAFDPLPLDAAEEDEIAALGGVATILLTNRDHARGAAAMRDRFGARILASRGEAARFDLKVDEVFECGPLEVVPGVRALALEGAKTPGEVAFFLPGCGTAVVGDAMLGAPAGALSFLSDEKLANPQALAVSLRRLWSLLPKALLLGDGAPLFAGVDDAMAKLLEARGGPAVNRINLDELEWESFDDAGGRYRGEYGEIGLLVGARKLGYCAVDLPPGARFCPLHAHDKEEEAFYVAKGEPTIRTLRGNLRLRPGDFMAFPIGDRGAHQLLNESGSPCTVILIGTDDLDEVAYYPDSQKLGLRRRGLRVRVDRLDYYDGE
ncbi:MAG: cupin domain-containing protein [Candidatus Tumulicola sp.]